MGEVIVSCEGLVIGKMTEDRRMMIDTDAMFNGKKGGAMTMCSVEDFKTNINLSGIQGEKLELTCEDEDLEYFLEAFGIQDEEDEELTKEQTDKQTDKKTNKQTNKVEKIKKPKQKKAELKTTKIKAKTTTKPKTKK